MNLSRSLANLMFALLLLAFAYNDPVQAAYEYNIEQIAPAIASQYQMKDIEDILNEQRPYYIVAYGTAAKRPDNTIVPAAPLKVVQTNYAACPYAAVYHNLISSTQFATYLACSTDLVAWSEHGQIHAQASQPDIRILYDNNVLYADEDKSTSSPRIKVRYYATSGNVAGLNSLVDNPARPPTNEKLLPHINFFSKADGTPEFGRIDYSGSILASKIEITHHYFNFGTRDIEAVDTFTNFSSGADATDNATNNLVTNAGGNGKIGDREVFKVGSTVYEVVEAQVNPTGDGFGSWRLFLINKNTSQIVQLKPQLAGGALSLGNPTVTFVRLPTGKDALVFTCYIFGENSGSTQIGGHMFVYVLQ
jgi:hypothetical protein